jgi:hypothetical protein
LGSPTVVIVVVRTVVSSRCEKQWHSLRLKRRGPVSRHIELDGAGGVGQHRLGPGAVADIARAHARRVMFLIAQVLGHLLLRAVSSTVLVSCLRSPSGSVNDSPAPAPTAPARPQPAARADSSAGFFFVTPSGVVITAPSTPRIPQRVRPETPLDPQSHSP